MGGCWKFAFLVDALQVVQKVHEFKVSIKTSYGSSDWDSFAAIAIAVHMELE